MWQCVGAHCACATTTPSHSPPALCALHTLPPSVPAGLPHNNPCWAPHHLTSLFGQHKAAGHKALQPHQGCRCAEVKGMVCGHEAVLPVPMWHHCVPLLCHTQIVRATHNIVLNDCHICAIPHTKQRSDGQHHGVHMHANHDSGAGGICLPHGTIKWHQNTPFQIIPTFTIFQTN